MGLFNCQDMDRRKEKIIILAAESAIRTASGKPSCLSSYGGGFTLLEKQLQMLSLYNFNMELITLVIGDSGPWKNIELSQDILDFGIDVLTVSNNGQSSAESLYSALKLSKINDTETVLIIYSDFVLKTSDLDKVFRETRDVIAVREARSTSEVGLRLNVQDSFPWFVFGGLLKLSFDTLRNLKFDENSKNVLELVRELPLVPVDLDAEVIEYDGVTSTFDLVGGSYASLVKKSVVRKQVNGKGALKLVNEIEWLETFSKRFPRIYPSVMDKHVAEELVWYEMPFYDLPSLRKLIISLKVNSQQVLEHVSGVLEHVVSQLYQNKYECKVPADFLRQKHYDRVYYRLFEVANYSQAYKSLVCEGDLLINGLNYSGLPEMFSKLLSLEGLNEIVSPTVLVDIHGDLHFQNILINERDNSFVLADPRGEINGSDFYYDLGKLWHSFNGLYDLIHTNQFKLDIDLENRKVLFEFTNRKLLKLYSEIKVLITELINNMNFPYKDENHMLKILFNEAMHFCSVSTFHINRYGDENRSMAMYITGIMLLNDFLNQEKILELKCGSPKYYFSSVESFKIQLMNNTPYEY